MLQRYNRSEKTVFSSFCFIALSVMILLTSMDFYNRYFYFLFSSFILFFGLNHQSFKINTTFFVLMFMSISFLIFDTETLYSFNAVLKQFAYPMCYLLGVNCVRASAYGVRDSKDNAEKLFKWFVIIVSLGILIHLLLNLIVNWDSNDRNVIEYWTKRSTSATCVAAFFCYGLGIIPALFLNKSGFWLKMYTIATIVIFYLFAMILAGRTFFVLFAITFLSVLFYYLASRNSFAATAKTFLIVLLIVLLVVVLFSTNTFGIKEGFEESNFYERFFGEKSNIDIGEDGRLERKLDYFYNMFDHPFGGGALKRAANNKFAHELYLDTYSRAGFISYILLVYFVFSRTFGAFKLIKSKQYSMLTNCLILGLFISINIEFFIEPIVEGVPWLLPTFCLLCGMIDSLRNYSCADIPENKGIYTL